MQIKYSINKVENRVIFCPDTEGLKIIKKNVSSTAIAGDLSRLYSDKKILLIIDKKIHKSITKYLIHDLKISNFKMSIMMVDGNKNNKDMKLLFKIINKLFDKKFTKKSVIISCGGGVIGDVSALASSLYLRGLIHFHIPTTMTAVIDSCIGGKTGINYKGIINSIGTYYHSKRVYISKNILNLIPKREFLAGIPEIIKCGLIHKKSILTQLNNKNKIIKRNFPYIAKIIKSALKTKIEFFKDDVNEENKRLRLNFGHTFAHAIEMALQTEKRNEIRHGEAVGLGLLCEIYYAFGKNNSFLITKKLLEKYKLPTNLKSFISKNQFNKIENLIYQNIFLDKKRVNTFPRYIKLSRIGHSNIAEMRDFDRIRDTIRKIILY
tara:strand:- start:358 stop:1494 length:1137 start_codon:yes stop_codon:yes gene_type:complete